MNKVLLPAGFVRALATDPKAGRFVSGDFSEVLSSADKLPVKSTSSSSGKNPKPPASSTPDQATTHFAPSQPPSPNSPSTLAASTSEADPSPQRVAITLPTTLPQGGYPSAPVWSRVYPEHWLANGYLSIVDVSICGMPDPERPLSLFLEGAEPNAVVEQIAPAIAGNSQSDESQVSVSVSATAHLIERAAEPDTDESIETLSHSLASAMAADHTWAERLMRVSRDSAGIRTLWLRDYALESGSISTLVERLRQLASREGVAIDRIVINGREAWRPDVSQGRN